MKKKNYSNYQNPKSKELNKKPVKKGSVIVGKLSDYEKLPKTEVDHKRESIVVLKSPEKELGVVYIHGLKGKDGKSRSKKVDAGLWTEIEKKGQKVYVDIDIRVKDVHGNPIKQGPKFQNTGVMISESEMKKVEEHIFKKKGRKKHSIRNIISENKKKTETKKG